MDWFRWYHGTTSDPKWRVVAKRSGQPLAQVVAVWARLLEHTSESADRGKLVGWNDEIAAAALDMETDAVAAIRTAMEGLVIKEGEFTGWAKRQPAKEDDSTERVRRHRARQRKDAPANPAPSETQESGDVTPCNADETKCNAPEKRREEQIQIQKLPPSSSSKRARGGTLDFEAEKQLDEVIRAANRGMIDNQALESPANPIPVGHGSREVIRDWLAAAPLELVKRIVYDRAKAYRPDGRRRQPTTMNYFDGAVRDEIDRWLAARTEVIDGDVAGIHAGAAGAVRPETAEESERRAFLASVSE